MQMIEWLISVDKSLFRFLNSELANPIFDLVMPVVTDGLYLRILMAGIVVALLIFGRGYGRVTALMCIVTIVITDQVTDNVLKPWIGRIRPCHALAGVHQLVDCGGGLSFPSAHAANTFGQAAILATRYPRTAWIWYPFAALVSYSRIAVGVHYPLDVIGGAALGLISGLVVIVVSRIAGGAFHQSKSGKS
jgi:undecaprenyl-diphosphatase